MPNSLKCRLKKLKHQGLLSEKDLSRIYTDNDVTEELEKIKGKVIACFNQEDNVFSSNFNLGIEMAISVIDKSIFELKGE